MGSRSWVSATSCVDEAGNSVAKNGFVDAVREDNSVVLKCRIQNKVRFAHTDRY